VGKLGGAFGLPPFSGVSMSKKVDSAVDSLKEAVDEVCRPEFLTKAQYIEVLEALIDDFKDRIQITQKELEG
jgi:hypothetical protein